MTGILKTVGIIIVVVSIFAAAIFFILFLNERSITNDKKAFFQEELKKLKGGNMKITSTAFARNQLIPSKYTCDGENINPPLQISDVPVGTKSLVLILDDPDAPMGTWAHWTVWNITPATKEIEENSVPNRAPWDPNSPAAPLPSEQGVTDFGQPGYGGPCPPSGTHRYFFKLFALDKLLNLPSSAKVSDIEKTMTGHIIDKTELIGLYKKQ